MCSAVNVKTLAKYQRQSMLSEDGNIQFEEFVRLTATKLKSDDEKTTELEEALKVFDKLGQG